MYTLYNVCTTAHMYVYPNFSHLSIYQASTTTVMPLTYNNWVVSTGMISHQVTLLVTPNVLVCEVLAMCVNIRMI